MPTKEEFSELRNDVEKNKQLLEENNELLKRMHRSAVWGFWLRIVWFVLLIGLPFALYFYVLEPYFEALGSSYETFSAGVQEIPGLKQLNNAFDTHQQESELQ